MAKKSKKIHYLYEGMMQDVKANICPHPTRVSSRSPALKRSA